MAIDVSVKGSPGWWLQRLMNELNNRERRRRMQLLYDYRTGKPPLPETADSAREAFEIFQRKARTNFAGLIVSAVSHRMTPVGFKTAVDDDATGDAEVGDIWQRAGLDVLSADAHDLMLGSSEAYVTVGNIDDETGVPNVTVEDPRWMVGERDPENKNRLLAALKILYDDVEREYRAYVYLPGRVTRTGLAEVWVASRPFSYREAPEMVLWRADSPAIAFNADGWDWRPDRSGALRHPMLPVVRFSNKDDLGEYETHLDVLDRINSQILWRLSIELLQAYKQRAVKGLPLEDEEGNEIDYSDVFTADPAAVWQLPAGADMWESGEVNLQAILSAVKDDIQELSGVTETPMYVFSPESANQSAEGASLARESLIFKVKDRISRTSYPWARVMSLILLQLGQTDRADLAKLRTMWDSPQKLSLSEMAAADAQALNTLPRRTRLLKIWNMSPAEADQVMTEVAAEQLQQMQMQQAIAMAQAAAANAQANTQGQGQGQQNNGGQQNGNGNGQQDGPQPAQRPQPTPPSQAPRNTPKPPAAGQ